MLSAGNDIVSLSAISVTRSKTPEFYARIVGPTEQALFQTLDQTKLPFEHFVWLLWSVKEAAYKYLHRLDTALIFSPVKFVVGSIAIPADWNPVEFASTSFTSQGLGGLSTLDSIITVKNTTLQAWTLIYKEFVCSFVNAGNDFGNVCWGIRKVEDTSYKVQSEAVRSFALESLRQVLGLDDLTIEKNQADVPVVRGGNLELGTPISLSHHGEWVGYCFLAYV
jgi:hypothetical protein